jgi:hypothetical protein
MQILYDLRVYVFILYESGSSIFIKLLAPLRLHFVLILIQHFHKKLDPDLAFS